MAELSDFHVDDLEHLVPGWAPGRHRSKTVEAYAAVRRAIVTHELPVSRPLDEAMLLDRFGIGRTPLREALKRLTHERFLRWPNRQAPVIRDIGLDELPRLYETRMIIEPEIALRAAERATEEDVARLRTLCDLLTEASSSGNTYQSVELDFAFHAAVAQGTRNRFLREASDNLNRQSLRLWYRSQQALGIEQVAVIHRDLAEAILRREPDAATALAREHVQRSIDRQGRLQAINMHERSSEGLRENEPVL